MSGAEDDAPPGFGAAPAAAGPPGLGGSPAPAAASSAAPPNLDGPPPGFPAKTSSDADALAEQLHMTAVDETADEPDLSLRLTEGLQEAPETEITTTVADDTIYHSAQSFEDLPLSAELLKGLKVEMKFEHPSRIQATTLPMIMTRDQGGAYRDLIAQAHNGSGKTTCFVLAMLSRVQVALQEPQALCMCPTRELVVQNLEVLRKMGTFTGITSCSTADEDGGQARRVAIKEQVVIGTHGRLKNWVSKRLLDVATVAILVFDEADEMLKADAFADDSVRLIRTIRKKNPAVQLLLFSATFNDKIKHFALKIAPMANQVFVPKEQLSLDVIKQYNVICQTKQDKNTVLKEMIFPNCEKLGQTIIFTQTRANAKTLHEIMTGIGFTCTSIEGSMLKAERDKVVREFRSGITKILISTDVLARGFDVSQVTLVVNYDVPTEHRQPDQPAFETYLHRIGRSGRFGRKGAAFNLIASQQDRGIMDQIARYFGKTIPEVPCSDEDHFLQALQEAGLTDNE